MPLPLFPVKPGDVISSVFMNALIDQMQQLDSRIGKLEGGAPGTSAVHISQVIPSTPVRIGDDIEILGSHFDFSGGAQRVYFDSTRATVFRGGSSDTRLIVQVPNVPNVSSPGTTVTLLVTNMSSSDSRSITLLPVTQQGNVFVTFNGVTPTTITPGQATPAIFSYAVECGTLLATTITITPTISVSNWQSLLQVVDSKGNVLPNGVLGLAPGQKAQFSVNLPTLPTPLGSPTSFTMTVAISGPGIAGTVDGPRQFQFGVNPNPDTSISLTPNGAVNPDGTPATAFNPATNTLTLAVGKTVTLLLKASFQQDGSYDLVPSPATGTSGWTMALNKSADFNTVSPWPITGATPTVPKIIFPAFDVTPQPGASAHGQATFTVHHTTAPADFVQTTSYQLVLG